MAQRDRYRLPLSTASGAAAEHYVRGVDQLLSGNLGAEAAGVAAVMCTPPAPSLPAAEVLDLLVQILPRVSAYNRRASCHNPVHLPVSRELEVWGDKRLLCP